MRTFTKSFLTLLLLCTAGAVNAQSLKVLDPNGERDWSQQADGDYPYYWMGDADDQPNFCGGTATVQVIDGALRIENTQEQAYEYDLQPFILDWFNTTQGEEYVIRIWLKSDVDGTANLSIGTWGTSGSARLDFVASDDYKIYTITHTAAVTSTGSDEHILFQMGKTVGTVYIQKVQILQMGEEKPVLSEHGDWISMINNCDMEEEDNSSFFEKIYIEGQGNDSPIYNPEIKPGIGVDGSRGIMVEATQKYENAWDNQFWFRFNEPIESGTKYRVTFDYKADTDAKVSTQAHAEPSDYIHYDMFGDLQFSTDWQTYTKGFDSDAKVSSQQSTSSKKFLSVAFNLSELEDANNYYFDNINFEVYVPGIDAQYNEGGIQILFPYYTNLVRLVIKGAEGKNRLMMPTNMFKVIADNSEAPIESVEADITGALYVFPDEEWAMEHLSEGSYVTITFTNSEDEKYRIAHLEEGNEAVESFDLIARYNSGLDILPYTYGVPALMSSDPENGSFNLPNTLSEFKLVFDKQVLCEKIEASLGSEKLIVEPATGAASEITLKRTGTASLENGEHKLLINKVYGEKHLDDNDYAKFEITFSIGAQESEELKAAIADANAVKDENDAERYYGEAFTALTEALKKYEAEIATYTAPSVVDAAIIDLNAKVKAVRAHRTLVDSFDESNAKAQQLVEEYAETKYNATEQYLKLKEIAAKYAGKNLTDDEELTTANDELKPIADLCNELFQEGSSNPGDAGIKVLTDRINQGVETLKSLGVGEDNPVIIEAGNAMTDDDAIADKIKQLITLKVYEQLKEPTNELFPTIIDEDTGEETTARINMSVFIKNPNIYALQAHNGYSPENVPGWIVPNGSAELNTIWRHDMRKIEGLAEDVAFTKYHSEVRMEQTITDLPAGIYTVVLDAVDWDEGDNTNGFCYAKTSDTPAVEEGEEEDRDVNFAATLDIEFHGQYVGNFDNEIEDIEVLDGQLTLGVNFGQGAQYEFDRAKLFLTAPAASFNYAMAYEAVAANVESAKTAKVRALQLYDLNGRRINKAQKGVVIVKKMMSDGTVKAEKVVK